jgi:hypothetical protein
MEDDVRLIGSPGFPIEAARPFGLKISDRY